MIHNFLSESTCVMISLLITNGSMPNISLQAWFVRGRELFHNIEYREGDTFSLFSDIIYFKYEQSVLYEDVIFGTEKKHCRKSPKIR
jgi:hypothetical protein